MRDLAAESSVYWLPTWEAHRAALGKDVPRVTGEELVTAMRTNVAEAQVNLAKARTNLHRLRADGKVVLDVREHRLRPVVVGIGKQARPDPFGDVGISDWVRACAELAHWERYLDWAKTKRGAPPAPDPRLPPEDDEKIPF